MNFALKDLELLFCYDCRDWIGSQSCKITHLIISLTHHSWNYTLSLLDSNFFHFLFDFRFNLLPFPLIHSLQLKVDLFEFMGSEVIHIKPIIVPRVYLDCLHVCQQLCISKQRKITNLHIITALNDRLTFTKYCKVTIRAIAHSKLLSRTDDICMCAVSYKDTRLTGSNKDCAVLTLIDVDTGGSIKQEDKALLAVRYLELLHLQLPGSTYQ